MDYNSPLIKIVFRYLKKKAILFRKTVWWRNVHNEYCLLETLINKYKQSFKIRTNAYTTFFPLTFVNIEAPHYSLCGHERMTKSASKSQYWITCLWQKQIAFPILGTSLVFHSSSRIWLGPNLEDQYIRKLVRLATYHYGSNALSILIKRNKTMK